MGALEEKLVENHMREAFLIKEKKPKDDYIKRAEVGTIVAFRLNFTVKREEESIKMTKIISGMITENDTEGKVLTTETRNGLKYGVPYETVVWVKTGDRWPKGVYEEMKRGAKIVDDNSHDNMVTQDEDSEFIEDVENNPEEDYDEDILDEEYKEESEDEQEESDDEEYNLDGLTVDQLKKVAEIVGAKKPKSKSKIVRAIKEVATEEEIEDAIEEVLG